MTVIEFAGSHPNVSELAMACDYSRRSKSQITWEQHIQLSNSPVMQWFREKQHSQDNVRVQWHIPDNMELRALQGTWHPLDHYLVSFEFEDPQEAMMFKLTWM